MSIGNQNSKLADYGDMSCVAMEHYAIVPNTALLDTIDPGDDARLPICAARPPNFSGHPTLKALARVRAG